MHMQVKQVTYTTLKVNNTNSTLQIVFTVLREYYIPMKNVVRLKMKNEDMELDRSLPDLCSH